MNVIIYDNDKDIIKTALARARQELRHLGKGKVIQAKPLQFYHSIYMQGVASTRAHTQTRTHARTHVCVFARKLLERFGWAGAGARLYAVEFCAVVHSLGVVHCCCSIEIS